MTTVFRIAAFVAVLVALAGPSALAEDDGAVPEGATPGDSRLDEARELNAEGRRLYAQGEYRLAIEAFKKAYELSKAPGLFFQLGQAQRASGDCSGALESYRRYLADVPEAPNRELVGRLITSMEACVERREARIAGAARPEKPVADQRPNSSSATSEASPLSQPVETDSHQRPRWGLRIAGVATVAVGAAACGLALKYGLDAREYQRTAEGHVAGEPWSDAEIEAFDSGPTAERRAIALSIVGGIAVAGGTALAIYGWTTSRDERPAVVPSIAPGQVGASFAYRF